MTLSWRRLPRLVLSSVLIVEMLMLPWAPAMAGNEDPSTGPAVPGTNNPPPPVPGTQPADGSGNQKDPQKADPGGQAQTVTLSDFKTFLQNAAGTLNGPPARDANTIGTLKAGTSVYDVGQPNSLPPGVSEAFSLIAEIVVEKTKRNGLAMLKERLESAICDWMYAPVSPEASSESKVLPSLCNLIQATDLEQLAGQGEAIRAALAADLLLLADTRVAWEESKDLKGAAKVLVPAARTALKATFEVVSRPKEEINPDLAWLVADSIINATWEALDPKSNEDQKSLALMRAGLYIARAQLAARRKVKNPPPIPDLIRLLLQDTKAICPPAKDPNTPNPCPTLLACVLKSPAEFQNVARWATLAVEAATAYKVTLDGNKPDLDRQLRASIDLVFKAAEEFARPSYEYLGLVKTLTGSALDGNYAAVIVALGEAAKDGLVGSCKPDATGCAKNTSPKEIKECEDAFAYATDWDAACKLIKTADLKAACESEVKGLPDCQRKIAKYTALLTAIVAYAKTFEKSDSPGSDEQKAALAAERRQQRKEALEGLIDATTDRSNRGGEWVAAVGANLGYLGLGTQRLQKAPDGESRHQRMGAQLALPLGVSFQKLPRSEGGWTRVFGFHSMLTLVDIGQYVAWDDEVAEVDTDWADLASPGLQVGLAVGRPDNFFTIGGHVSYAPNLYDVDMEVLVDPNTNKTRIETEEVGALRYGVFFQYFVPLFDLN